MPDPTHPHHTTMLKLTRIAVTALFWVINLWWLGHIVQALRTLPDGTFRVYSVQNADMRLEAKGLTFSGDTGLALAIAYCALIVYALLATTLTRGIMWIGAIIILIAWAAVFAGNSLWLEMWTAFDWWDAVNYGGAIVVLIYAALNVGPRCFSARKTASMKASD